MAKGKVNPRRRPVSQHDLEKARNDAVDCSCVIVLMALLDRGFLQPEQMSAAWKAVSDKSDAVTKGYCSVKDMQATMIEEYGIKFGR